MILDVLPDLLREFFKRRWNIVYPELPWGDNQDSGDLFWNGSANATAALPGRFKVKNGSGLVRTTEDLTELLSPGDVIVVENRRWKLLKPINKDRITVNTKPDIEGDFEAFALDIRCELNVQPNMKGPYEKLVLPGRTLEWDISLLTFALLNSSHNLLPCEAMKEDPAITRPCEMCASCAARGAVQECRHFNALANYKANTKAKAKLRAITIS